MKKLTSNFIEENLDIPVKLIDENGELSIKEYTLKDLVELASYADLDIIQLNDETFKLMDYNKHLYKQQKKERKNRQNGVSKSKDIKISVNIGDNDLKTKAKQASDFISKQYEVKIIVQFKERESKYVDNGFKTLDKFTALITEKYKHEKTPNIDGKNISIIISPIK